MKRLERAGEDYSSCGREVMVLSTGVQGGREGCGLSSVTGELGCGGW